MISKDELWEWAHNLAKKTGDTIITILGDFDFLTSTGVSAEEALVRVSERLRRKSDEETKKIRESFKENDHQESS